MLGSVSQPLGSIWSYCAFAPSACFSPRVFLSKEFFMPVDFIPRAFLLSSLLPLCFDTLNFITWLPRKATNIIVSPCGERARLSIEVSSQILHSVFQTWGLVGFFSPLNLNYSFTRGWRRRRRKRKVLRWPEIAKNKSFDFISYLICDITSERLG